MMRTGFAASILFLTLVWPGGFPARCEEQPTPPFAEVYESLRTNLPATSDEELNRAAVRGLVDALHPAVLLVDESASDKESAGPVQARIFDESYGYLRIENVKPGLADRVMESLKELTLTNELKGLVVDLRFSGGEAYEEVAGVANIFVRREHDLLDYGEGMVKSESKWDAMIVPVTALVNGRTHSAAEVLAGVLRETGAALLVGGETAGEATVRREVALAGGYRLLLGGTPVKLGNGMPVPDDGLSPDVAVRVEPSREAAYLKEPYKDFASTDENDSPLAAIERRRINEAELVREKRNLLDPSSANNGDELEPFEPEHPVIRDPALSRAIDLLKGLAILNQNRAR